ncbi:MAG: hypothetical protein CBARDMAM_2082 [uncultured Caballeronia sp.]|nr:MAG: hypothetical protein CBARDMAM_2082 [uncultured Caballeronia sp.]
MAWFLSVIPACDVDRRTACRVAGAGRVAASVELRAWGWRIPFGIGALAAVVSLYLRKSLDVKPPPPKPAS